MDTRRLLIAALLSLAIMIAWSYFFPPPEPTRPPMPAAGESAEEATPPSLPPEVAAETPVGTEPPGSMVPSEEAQAPREPEPIQAESEEQVVIEGDGFRARFTNRGAQLVSYELLEHEAASGGPVDLVRRRVAGPYVFGFASLEGVSSPINEVLFQVEREATADGDQTLRFRYRGDPGFVEKRFSFSPDGLLDVQVDTQVRTDWTLVLGPGLRNPSSEELENRFSRRAVVYRTAEGVETIDPLKVKSAEGLSAIGLQWVGLQDTYFLTAVVPQQGLEGVVMQPAVVVPGAGEDEAQFTVFRDSEQLDESQEKLEREIFLLLVPQSDRLHVTGYLGAKEFDRLSSLPYGLEETVQLGWFKFLSLPLLWGLRWIHDNLVANYGWAIILMTILIRLVLFPLTHKSTVSMQKMQEINPKVQAIRNKYRGKLKDKQGRPNPEMQRKMNEETMALYKAEGVNPAGGCLPMLLQIPVLFAFYNILSSAIEIRHAPWIFWITDLSAKDPFYVLPIVMGGTQFLQQKMTPAAGDPMQRRIFALMPIFFTILFLGFPSGLVLYWLTNNVLGIGQQYAYKRMREARAASTEQAAGTGAKGKKGSKG